MPKLSPTMALVHKTKKVTHCLSATKQYMRRFFSTLTHMYETGLQTDLTIVASDGTSFSIHKVIIITEALPGIWSLSQLDYQIYILWNQFNMLETDTCVSVHLSKQT